MRTARQPARRVRDAISALVAGVAFAGGCELQDEQALVGRAAWWWTTSVAEPAPGGLIAGPPGMSTDVPAIEYVEGFVAGARRSATSGLPMLVVFRADWCRWSKELSTTVAANRRLVALSRRFVCVSVDADRDADTCRTFGVDAFPTVLVLEAEGGERHRFVGANATQGLIAAMEGVLEHGAHENLAAGDRDRVR